MAVPIAAPRLSADDNPNLQLYYPMLMTSPAFPQAGDSYLSDIELSNIDIKAIYMEKGEMEPDPGWDGTKYDWSEDVTEIQSDFVDAGNSTTGNYNLLFNTALSTKEMEYWHKIFEVPFEENSTNFEQAYNWIYSKIEPSDKTKIWVDLNQKDFTPLYWYQNKWQNYYEFKSTQINGDVKIIEQSSGNSFQITKTGFVQVGIGQYTKLKFPINNGNYLTAGVDLEEKTDSGGITLRMEFLDINGKILETKYSPRYFNKTNSKKRFAFTFAFTDRTNSCDYIRFSVLGVDDRKVNAAVNRIKVEYGLEDTGWNLNEEEVALNLNAGEIEMPVINGRIDKDKVISEIAILRSVLGEGLLKWEEVTRLKASSMQEAVLYDYFVENGNYYRYALQPILANGMKGAITIFYDTVSTFEGFWLLGEDDMQFSFIYNGKIGEIKHNKPIDIIETISGQYPYFVGASDLNYRTFQFSGTLTYHQDVHKLLTSDTYSAAISPDPTIPISYVELKYGDEMLLNYKNDLEEMQDGMVMQRVWRDKILKWLNDGKPKILKSEAQGDMLVMIRDVQVTPIESLFGLVSDFQCQMTEIGHVDEKTLQKYKLRKSELTKEDLVKEAMKETSL